MPNWFGRAFQLYVVVFVITGLVLAYLSFRFQSFLFGLLLPLAPSVFYALFIGAFWSELRLRAVKPRRKARKRTKK